MKHDNIVLLLLAVWIILFAAFCNCNTISPAACDYEVSGLKNWFYDMQVNTESLNGNTDFNFPYIYPYDDLQTDLQAWTDGIVTITVDPETGAVSLSITGTTKIYEYATMSGLPDGTPAAVFQFNSSCE